MANAIPIVSEEWRPVVGYEGFYEVSNLGRVRSVDRVIEDAWGRQCSLRGVLRKPYVSPKGYPLVRLSVGNVRKYFTVHRLVAIAFLGPPPLGKEVCHTDGDKLNPRADNLRWGTPSENQADNLRNGTWANQNVGKTHCKRGHEFTPENTDVSHPANRRSPSRSCKTCRRLRYLARKEAA